jgi:hypothetical protein
MDSPTPGLLADQNRCAVLNCFKGRQAVRFGDRRHDEQISDAEAVTPVLATLEAGEDDIF